MDRRTFIGTVAGSLLAGADAPLLRTAAGSPNTSTVSATWDDTAKKLTVYITDTSPNRDRWVGYYPQGHAPDPTNLDWFYLNNTKYRPQGELFTSATIDAWQFAPSGNFTVHLLGPSGYTSAASANFTVPAPTSNTISAAIVNGHIVVTVRHANPQAKDWVGIYPHGETDPKKYLAWAYLNNSQTLPTAGVAYATLSPFACPAGTVDIRLLNGANATLVSTSLTLSTPIVVLPEFPTRWIADEELTLVNFGPGVSTIAGVTNPAGPRTGVVLTVETGTITGGSRPAFTPGSLNGAMHSAQYGDDIVCAAQSSKPAGYVGEFVVPLDAGTTGGSSRKAVVPGVTPMLPWRPTEPSYIRIMSSGWASLPLRRITPADTAHLFKLKGANGNRSATRQSHVLSFAYAQQSYPTSSDATRPHHYWWQGMQIETADVPQGGGLFLVQSAGSLTCTVATPATPHHMIWDRCWFRGNPTGVANMSASRGILDPGYCTGILHCRMDGFNTNASTECSAVLVAGDSEGNIYALNTYFSASTQGVMHGGTGNRNPGHCLYERCEFAWDQKWEKDSFPGIHLNEKPLLATVSGTTITPQANWSPYATPGSRDSFFFIPNVAHAPVHIIATSGITGSTGANQATSNVAYGNATNVQHGFLRAYATIDCAAAERSPGVTVSISGSTITRSSGTFGGHVTLGRYFFVLNSLTPKRYLITDIASNRQSLTVSGTPGDATGVVNWVIGTWDGQDVAGKMANFWEVKAGHHFALVDCVFHDYWINQAQAYPIAFKNGDVDPGPSEHMTMRGCLFQRVSALWNDTGKPPCGPVLIEDNLAVLGGRFPTGTGGYAQQDLAPNIAWRHNTFIMEEDVTDIYPYQPGALFALRQSGGGQLWVDNLFAMGNQQVFLNRNDGGAGPDDHALRTLGIPPENVNYNIFFGGNAVGDLRVSGALRVNTVPSGKTRYANVALTSRKDAGFVNGTGLESGDYRLQPVYTTAAGALSVSGEKPGALRLASGAFPATIQKGTLFRVLVDGVDKLTSVASRDSNGTHITLAAAYPGTVGGGLTGVFTFQGSATDATDPGARNLAARMATWSDVLAGAYRRSTRPAADKGGAK